MEKISLAPHVIRNGCDQATIDFQTLGYSGKILDDELCSKKNPSPRIAWLMGPGNMNLLAQPLGSIARNSDHRARIEGFFSNYRFVLMLTDLGQFQHFSVFPEKIHPDADFVPWNEVLNSTGIIRLEALPTPLFNSFQQEDVIPLYRADPRLHEQRLTLALTRLLCEPLPLPSDSRRLIEKLEENAKQGIAYETTAFEFEPKGQHWLGILFTLMH